MGWPERFFENFIYSQKVFLIFQYSKLFQIFQLKKWEFFMNFWNSEISTSLTEQIFFLEFSRILSIFSNILEISYFLQFSQKTFFFKKISENSKKKNKKIL